MTKGETFHRSENAINKYSLSLEIMKTVSVNNNGNNIRNNNQDDQECGYLKSKCHQQKEMKTKSQ